MNLVNRDAYKVYITTGRGMGKTWFQEALRKSQSESDEEVFDYWRKNLVDRIATQERIIKRMTWNYYPIVDAVHRLAVTRGIDVDVEEEEFSKDDGCTRLVLCFHAPDGTHTRYEFSKYDLERADANINAFAEQVVKRIAWGLDNEREKKNKERLETAMKNTAKVEYHSYSRNRTAQIKNVIFNPPATIVLWNDNTKTVVKAQNGEPFDPEKGLAMAIAKKHFGNQGNYFNKIRKWTEQYKEPVKKVSNTPVTFELRNVSINTGMLNKLVGENPDGYTFEFTAVKPGDD